MRVALVVDSKTTYLELSADEASLLERYANKLNDPEATPLVAVLDLIDATAAVHKSRGGIKPILDKTYSKVA